VLAKELDLWNISPSLCERWWWSNAQWCMDCTCHMEHMLQVHC